MKRGSTEIAVQLAATHCHTMSHLFPPDTVAYFKEIHDLLEKNEFESDEGEWRPPFRFITSQPAHALYFLVYRSRPAHRQRARGNAGQGGKAVPSSPHKPRAGDRAGWLDARTTQRLLCCAEREVRGRAHRYIPLHQLYCYTATPLSSSSCSACFCSTFFSMTASLLPCSLS